MDFCTKLAYKPKINIDLLMLRLFLSFQDGGRLNGVFKNFSNVVFRIDQINLVSIKTRTVILDSSFSLYTHI